MTVPPPAGPGPRSGAAPDPDRPGPLPAAVPEAAAPTASTLALTALLAEYNSLRQESLQAITNRIQIMNFAFTTLSVVIAAMLTTKVSGAVLIPACLVFVPGAAKASLLIWLGEYHRSQRAGRGAALVESRINGLLGQRDLVGWESRLLSTSTHMGYPYVSTALFILSTGVLAEFLGAFLLMDRYTRGGSPWDNVAVMLGVLLYAALCEVLFLRFYLRRWRVIRTAGPPPA
ncbi:hypothetical protein [Streptomyces racemochromogenes]|uniref:hypothetical protein n=1 Tax=Streptomyces racemochromogenes TaxID=67353 RepID=UPI0031EC67B5